ncbi:hypothetical protein WICPIJ_001914, partial [Wickerhamomyces pijperi]
ANRRVRAIFGIDDGKSKLRAATKAESLSQRYAMTRKLLAELKKRIPHNYEQKKIPRLFYHPTWLGSLRNSNMIRLFHTRYHDIELEKAMPNEVHDCLSTADNPFEAVTYAECVRCRHIFRFHGHSNACKDTNIGNHCRNHPSEVPRPSSQRTIEVNFVGKGEPFEHLGRIFCNKEERMRYDLLMYFWKDSIPFRKADSPDFISFLASFYQLVVQETTSDSRITGSRQEAVKFCFKYLRKRKWISKMVDRSYDCMKEGIVQLLATKNVSLCVDIWKNYNSRYLGVLMYSDFGHVLLAFENFSDRRETATEIANALGEVIKQHKIEERVLAITFDNFRANPKTLMHINELRKEKDLAPLYGVRCVSHILNLILGSIMANSTSKSKPRTQLQYDNQRRREATKDADNTKESRLYKACFDFSKMVRGDTVLSSLWTKCIGGKIPTLPIQTRWTSAYSTVTTILNKWDELCFVFGKLAGMGFSHNHLDPDKIEVVEEFFD